MTTPAFNLLDAPYIYDGVPIHARGLTLAAVYASAWSPSSPAPSASPWTEYGHVANTWRHRAFPGHILWKPTPQLVFVAHLSTSSSAPKFATVEALAHAALGPGAVPIHEVMLPLSLRLPLKGPGQLPVPDGYFRCHRLWPLPDEKPKVEEVHGVPVELRVSGTHDATGLSVWAEAFIGWKHVDATDAEGNERPRAMVFPGDARRLVLPQDESEVKRLVAGVMDLLLAFAYWRLGQGLEVDRHGHLPGRLVGRARVAARETDVEFAVRLPQPYGTVKYIGDYYAVS